MREDVEKPERDRTYVCMTWEMYAGKGVHYKGWNWGGGGVSSKMRLNAWDVSWVTCSGERLSDECTSRNTVIEATRLHVVYHKDPDCNRLSQYHTLTEILD